MFSPIQCKGNTPRYYCTHKKVKKLNKKYTEAYPFDHKLIFMTVMRIELLLSR